MSTFIRAHSKTASQPSHYLPSPPSKSEPLPTILQGAKPIPFLISISIGLIVRFFVPKPVEVTAQAWQLLSIFLSTSILQPLTSQTQSSNHPLSRCHLHSAVKSLTLRPGVCIPSPFRARAQSHQMDGSDSRSKETTRLSSVEPILRFARGNVLPLAHISTITLGLTYPSLGCALDKYHVSKIGPFGIFVISGLMLRSEEIGAAVEAWPIGLFGLVSILFLTPYFSRIILQVHLQPQEFITGLAIFCCMPTTLSSGVALTQLAGGNAALALAMTVISNLLGILIVPYSITKFVASGVGVTLPTKQ